MDACKECVARGDIQKCEATKCSKHDSWYAQELKRQIEPEKGRHEDVSFGFDTNMIGITLSPTQGGISN